DRKVSARQWHEGRLLADGGAGGAASDCRGSLGEGYGSVVVSKVIAVLVLMMAIMAGSATGETSEADLMPTVALQPFLQQVRPEALKAGVSAATFDRATRGLEPDPQVLMLAAAQPEFVKPIWE